ncbi:hypothetical protein ACLKA6_008055 [Drosophila palustris]
MSTLQDLQQNLVLGVQVFKCCNARASLHSERGASSAPICCNFEPQHMPQHHWQDIPAKGCLQHRHSYH